MNPLLLKKPYITEKSVDLGSSGKYIFLIDKNSSSSELKKIIEKLYSVNVVKTNIVNLPGKKKRFGSKFSKQEGKKKIIVTLKKGQKINTLPE
ncbi:MAG: 50S ribosomal protein L23 [Candidatus Pacebacteria bacterium]|nr:50S ribosomal protein L23 [Candidatus Paceibacterota bacterium]